MIKEMLCRFLGHKWRRLTVKERKERNAQAVGANVAVGLVLPQVRICNRCGATRVVKPRNQPRREREQICR